MISTWKTKEKDRKFIKKKENMAQNRIFIPPDRPWFWIIPGQQLYTYSLRYSKLIVTQKNMIPTWKTIKKKTKISKNLQKMAIRAKNPNFWPPGVKKGWKWIFGKKSKTSCSYTPKRLSFMPKIRKIYRAVLLACTHT